MHSIRELAGQQLGILFTLPQPAPMVGGLTIACLQGVVVEQGGHCRLQIDGLADAIPLREDWIINVQPCSDSDLPWFKTARFKMTLIPGHEITDDEAWAWQILARRSSVATRGR